jgi:hypothetical protein
MQNFRSHQIFKIGLKELSDGERHRIFGKSTRYMDMWAADPRFCEVTRRNPLDQLKAFLSALDDHGRADVARAAIEFLAQPVGLRVCSDAAPESDKGSVDGEIADVTRALGRLTLMIESAREDGALETAELIRIKRAAVLLKCECDQLLDAAGIKGGA